MPHIEALIGWAGLPTLTLRQTSLVPAPAPLLRLRDFHSIDSALRKAASRVLDMVRYSCIIYAPLTNTGRSGDESSGE